MTYAVVKSIHFVALALLLGGPFFWWLVWSQGAPAGALESAPSRRRAADRLLRRVRLAVLAGSLLFSCSAAADALRAASAVVDLSDSEMLLAFLRRTRYGQASVFKAGLAPIFALLYFLATSHAARSYAPVRRILLGGIVLLGFALAAAISATSHASAREGLTPVAIDVVHTLAGVVWGGGVIYLALLPWRDLLQRESVYAPAVCTALRRFSLAAVFAAICVAATGIISSYFFVYDVNSLAITPYGRTLVRKLALFAAVLSIAALNMMVLIPRLERHLRGARADRLTPRVTSRSPHGRSGQTAIARTFRLLRAALTGEALLLVGVLAAAGTLTTLPPADKPGYVAHGSWKGRAGPYEVVLDMASSAPTSGEVEIGIFLSLDDGTPVGTPSVFIQLEMLDHEMGLSRLKAQPVSPGYFAADGIISMAGAWQARIEVTPADGETYVAVIPFEAASGALDQGRVRRFDLGAPWSVPEARLPLSLGFVVLVLAVVAVVGAHRGVLAEWAKPFGVGVAALGLYQVLSLSLINAYPTTYWENPVPYTAETIARGAPLFQAHCAVCHGEYGYGDGPAAAALNPRPADLSAPHVDDHTDGDIFWWLTHGIPGTAMTGWGDVLTEEERWILVRYVRNIRHGIPPEMLAQ